jgi:hypothetical protein
MSVPLEDYPIAQKDASPGSAGDSNPLSRTRRPTDDEILGLAQAPETAQSGNSRLELNLAGDGQSPASNDGETPGKNTPSKEPSEQNLPQNLRSRRIRSFALLGRTRRNIGKHSKLPRLRAMPLHCLRTWTAWTRFSFRANRRILPSSHARSPRSTPSPSRRSRRRSWSWQTIPRKLQRGNGRACTRNGTGENRPPPKRDLGSRGAGDSDAISERGDPASIFPSD